VEALERARNVSFKLRIRRRDGSWRWTRWNLDRGPDGYRGVFMDITEQEWQLGRLEQHSRLEGSREMAGRLADRLGGLVALTLDDLRALGLPPGQAPQLDQALRRLEATGPNAFLEGLLAAARTEAGPDTEIEFQPGPDLPPVPLDPAQMDLAVLALLRNARQAMSGPGTIHLTSGLLSPRRHRPGGAPGSEKSRVWFEVRDQGPGMAAEQQKHLFDPLFSARVESGSCGLGLALVKTIVDGHHGSIQVESDPERGTSVRLLLPV
jgi:signal transduction histidine kinase